MLQIKYAVRLAIQTRKSLTAWIRLLHTCTVFQCSSTPWCLGRQPTMYQSLIRTVAQCRWTLGARLHNQFLSVQEPSSLTSYINHSHNLPVEKIVVLKEKPAFSTRLTIIRKSWRKAKTIEEVLASRNKPPTVTDFSRQRSWGSDWRRSIRAVKRSHHLHNLPLNCSSPLKVIRSSPTKWVALAVEKTNHKWDKRAIRRVSSTTMTRIIV